MEPIAFLGAPIRRWPVIVVVAFVAMIVALLIPVSAGSSYPANTWRAEAQVGLTPQYIGNKLGAKLSLKQLEFYAHSPVVLATAARSIGVPVTKQLENDVYVQKLHSPGKPSVLLLALLQPTKGESAKFTNAFVSALGSYAQVQVADQHKNSLYIEGVYIQNLQKAISSLPKKTTPLVTPTTTATTAPHKAKVKKTTTTTTATTTTTTTAHSLGVDASHAALTADAVPSHQGDVPAVLAADTTTTAPVATTPTTAPAVGVTPTTVPVTATLPNRSIVEENKVLSNELGQAIATQQRLQAEGVPKTGYRVVSPAARSSAVRLNPDPPLLANGWIRLLLGLLLGVVFGVLVTWLIDALDRRVRTSKRAEELLGLPLITEIPAPASSSMSVIPVVDIVVDPYSEASEAYRKLHVAVLTAPTVTWVKRGALGGGLAPAPVVERAPALQAVGVPASATASPDAGTAAPEPGPAHPVALTAGAPGLARRKRFSILVTSAHDETSRSLVVVNLAAVYAEAGDRVLVATTGGMRTEFEGNGVGPRAWEGGLPDTSPSELIANARPSQIPGVSSLALGQLFSNPSRLALKAGGLVEAARDLVDVLVLEAPLLSTQDGAALFPVVDLVVVVCEAWETRVSEVQRVQALLTQRRPPVLGFVMTNVPVDHAKLLNG